MGKRVSARGKPLQYTRTGITVLVIKEAEEMALPFLQILLLAISSELLQLADDLRINFLIALENLHTTANEHFSRGNQRLHKREHIQVSSPLLGLTQIRRSCFNDEWLKGRLNHTQTTHHSTGLIVLVTFSPFHSNY